MTFVLLKELGVRRRIAGKLLREGRGTREVGRIIGASPSSVGRWKKAIQKDGLKGLKAKSHPGRRTRLHSQQKERLGQILLDGPLAEGFATDLWTVSRVAQVIERTFGVKYHPGHVWYVLRDLGWSAQKPERQARERDEEAIWGWNLPRPILWTSVPGGISWCGACRP